MVCDLWVGLTLRRLARRVGVFVGATGTADNMLAVSGSTEQWSASPGDVVRCRVELVYTALDPSIGGTSVWVDWFAAQCCGFCTRHSAAAAAKFTTQPSVPSTLATSLPDETQAGVPGRTCFLASSPQVRGPARRQAATPLVPLSPLAPHTPCTPCTPSHSARQVVAAGLQLEAGRPVSFLVSVTLPQQQLPPSFAGHAASYECAAALALATRASHMRQPHAPQAVTTRTAGCNHAHPVCRLHPHGASAFQVCAAAFAAHDGPAER